MAPTESKQQPDFHTNTSCRSCVGKTARNFAAPAGDKTKSPAARHFPMQPPNAAQSSVNLSSPPRSPTRVVKMQTIQSGIQQVINNHPAALSTPPHGTDQLQRGPAPPEVRPKCRLEPPEAKTMLTGGPDAAAAGPEPKRGPGPGRSTHPGQETH